MSHLRDRVVWLTGASSGIGAAMVREFVRRGAKVVATARRIEQLEAVRASTESPDRVTLLPLDVTHAEVDDAVASAVAAFGRVDVLVHAAGIGQRGLAADTEIDVVRRIMEVNFFAVVGLTRGVLPGMLERGDGQIVVISSLAGHVGSPRRSAYSASKHALQGYCDSLRAEVHGLGVAVTVICPGFVATEFTHSALTGDGSAYQRGWHRPPGISADKCARLAVDAVEKRKRERFIGGRELSARWLKRLSPGALAAIIRRVKSS